MRGQRLVIDGTLVMGIVNASPESFSDGRVAGSPQQSIELADSLIDAGADILDVGGQSAVTNQPELDAQDEVQRVLPIVEWLARNRPHTPVSVDTYKPLVVDETLKAGASIINDVSGLAYPEIAAICARHGAALVVMHTSAAPKQRLQRADLYGDVRREVLDFLRARLAELEELGFGRESVIVDPGPDFTKTPHQTLALMRDLDAVRALGRPLLLALSRKDFLGAIVQRSPRGRDAATLAAITLLTHDRPGNIVRVHDVSAVRDVLRTVEFLKGQREIEADYVLPDELRYERPR
jgi:dihydropteroate synthase